MEYQTIEQLQKDFTEGRIQVLPEEISIGGIIFKLSKSSEYPLSDMVNKNLKGIVLYSLVKNPTNLALFNKAHSSVENSLYQDRVAFIWAFGRLRMHPVATKFISAARSEPMLQSGIVREENIANDRIIGQHVNIILSGFNNGEQLSAKVDTGAQICSLHAQQIEFKHGKNMVSFVFGNKRYTMPALELQAVQTADAGVENRPVVVFDVIVPNHDVNVKNKIVKKIKFNLNDRSNMPDKILLGQNFIHGGDFVVVSDHELANQQQTEAIDWDNIQEEFKDISYVEQDKIEKIIDMLEAVIRTDTLNELRNYSPEKIREFFIDTVKNGNKNALTLLIQGEVYVPSLAKYDQGILVMHNLRSNEDVEVPLPRGVLEFIKSLITPLAKYFEQVTWK